MKLLFVKLKLIGDALLLTGTLRAVKLAYPEAELHVVVRKGAEGILAGCPDIHTVHTTGDKSGGKFTRLRRELGLIRRLREVKFDRVFELGDGDRGRILAVLSGAPRRYANSAAFGSRLWFRLMPDAAPLKRADVHASRWDLDAVRLAFPEIPSEACLTPIFERARANFSWTDERPAAERRPAFLHPVASRAAKCWTLQGWIAVGKALVADGYPLILSSGPSPAEVALCREIFAGIGSDSVRLTEGRPDWSGVAGALYRSAVYVGTDTAAMHLAAACGTPIVALFAHPPESRLSLWRPLSPSARVLQPDQETDPVSAIPAQEVVNAIAQLIPLPVSVP